MSVEGYRLAKEKVKELLEDSTINVHEDGTISPVFHEGATAYATLALAEIGEAIHEELARLREAIQIQRGA